MIKYGFHFKRTQQTSEIDSMAEGHYVYRGFIVVVYINIHIQVYPCVLLLLGSSKKGKKRKKDLMA